MCCNLRQDKAKLALIHNKLKTATCDRGNITKKKRILKVKTVTRTHETTVMTEKWRKQVSNCLILETQIWSQFTYTTLVKALSQTKNVCVATIISYWLIYLLPLTRTKRVPKNMGIVHY